MDTTDKKRTIRVLIIEDSRSCLESMTRKIDSLNKNSSDIFYEVIDAGLTEMVGGALKRIRDHRPDIILLDMNYGGKTNPTSSADGCLVARHLNENDRKKIICTSGEPEIYIKFLISLGVDHFGGKYNFIDCITNKCGCKQIQVYG